MMKTFCFSITYLIFLYKSDIAFIKNPTNKLRAYILVFTFNDSSRA